MADVLHFQKVINSEEMCKGTDALGEEVVGHLGYYELRIAPPRWVGGGGLRDRSTLERLLGAGRFVVGNCARVGSARTADLRLAA